MNIKCLNLTDLSDVHSVSIIGPRCSGKTTIAEAIAKENGYSFVMFGGLENNPEPGKRYEYVPDQVSLDRIISGYDGHVIAIDDSIGMWFYEKGAGIRLIEQAKNFHYLLVFTFQTSYIPHTLRTDCVFATRGVGTFIRQLDYLYDRFLIDVMTHFEFEMEYKGLNADDFIVFLKDSLLSYRLPSSLHKEGNLEKTH